MPENSRLLAAIAWLQALSLPGMVAMGALLAVAACALAVIITRAAWRIQLRPMLAIGLVLGAAWSAYGLLAAAQAQADAAVPLRAMARPSPHAPAKTRMEPARFALESPAR